VINMYDTLLKVVIPGLALALLVPLIIVWLINTTMNNILGYSILSWLVGLAIMMCGFSLCEFIARTCRESL